MGLASDNVEKLAILLMCTHFRVQKYQSAMKMLQGKAATAKASIIGLGRRPLPLKETKLNEDQP